MSEKRELPKGWVWAKIGQICKILDGIRKPVKKENRKSGPYPYYGATGIVDYVDGYLFDEKLVLVGEDGAKWQSGDCTAFIAEGKFWVNNHAHVLRPLENLHPEFLQFTLNAADLSSHITGTTVLKLNQKKLREIEIPLPPLAEQERIAGLLARQMTAVEKARKAAEEKLAAARLLPPAFLRDAFTQNKNLSNWKSTQLGDVILDIKDGGTPPRKNPDNFGGDVNWCVVKDIKPEIWSTRETLTPKGLQNCSAKVWPNDSVIISLGATIGNVGIARIPLATKQGLSGIIVDSKKILSKFLYYILLDNAEFIRSIASGTTFKDVRPSKLRTELRFPLPPLAEQNRIADLLDRQMAATTKATCATESELREIRALPAALLRQAFAGAL